MTWLPDWCGNADHVELTGCMLPAEDCELLVCRMYREDPVTVHAVMMEHRGHATVKARPVSLWDSDLREFA